ncbi:DUF1697 domain-containing protein [Aquimarina sediminis]|uniref:DUF1697 domain-containing protein n=1 Tax=Aquimarina sediminis TaxID=2070536 RepID=UPI0013E8DC20|nr:DUF1697 domain-containing protein [Aquimarina sediminis]
MKTYIALLRGINVSGQKVIKMADLKDKLQNIGLTSVTTYIQSGNIIFKYNNDSTKTVSQLIKKEILKQYGFEVPVLVLTPEILVSIYKNNPFAKRLETEELEEKKMFFTLLSDAPDMAAIKELSSDLYKPEEFIITNRVVYFYAANGYARTKLTTNFFEKKLHSIATTRNLKTMIKLLELSDLS